MDRLPLTVRQVQARFSTTLPLGVFGLKNCVSAVPNPLFAGVVLPNNGSDSIQCVMIINCGDITSVYTRQFTGVASADYSFKPATSQHRFASHDTAIFLHRLQAYTTGVSNASFDVAGSDGTAVKVPLVGADDALFFLAAAPQVPTVGEFDNNRIL